jgi:hypothetical protein
VRPVTEIADYQPDDDQAEADGGRNRLSRLYAIADEAIAAGVDVLVAAVWVKADGTVGKAPLTLHSHLDAHGDVQRIRQELAFPPHVPTGVPEDHEVVVGAVPGSGGFVLLDCDVKAGKVGRASLEALVAEHGNFVTSAWRTPSGGANVLLRKPPGASYGNSSPWPGIDVRADGGWVVAPGNTCAGGSWAWLDGTGWATASELPAGMAAQLSVPSRGGPKATGAEVVALIEASTREPSLRAMHAFRDELERFAAVGAGSRHDGLVRIVGWAFGMGALDLREALAQIQTEWRRLTAGEGREDEVAEVARWVVGQERQKRAAAVPAVAMTSTDGAPATDRFRRRSVGELLAADRTFHWDIVGMLAQHTYGLDAGELKTLKSYFGMARAIGLAAGVPVLGKWKVPERRRVLVFVAEGGLVPYTNRLERMAYAHGVTLADLEGWLAVIDDVAPLDSEVFRDALAWHLRDFEPGLVHLDPLYPFQPPGVSPSQYVEIGRMLTATHRLCADHGATFWMTAHMNQTGAGFDLKRVSGAGHGEWGDSWALLRHRAAPDVDAGRFRLALALGSRQWGGTTWDLDLNIGRFDPDLGVHDGPITWNVQSAAGPSSAAGVDPLVDVKLDVLRVGRKLQPLTRQSWLARVNRKNEWKRAAFDELVDAGQILQKGAGKSPTFEVAPGR